MSNKMLDLLKEYNINYVLNQSTDIKFHGFGIGDLLFSIISLESLQAPKRIENPMNRMGKNFFILFFFNFIFF